MACIALCVDATAEALLDPVVEWSAGSADASKRRLPVICTGCCITYALLTSLGLLLVYGLALGWYETVYETGMNADVLNPETQT